MSGHDEAVARSFLYAVLARAFLPRLVWSRYGDQMQAAFASLRTDARREAGTRGVLRVWLREVRQLASVGPVMRREARNTAAPAADSTAFSAGRAFSGRSSGSGPEWGSDLMGDVRYALRGLRRAPLLATSVVVTLALGLGANATIFGVIDRLLLRAPNHIIDAEQVRRIYVTRQFGSRVSFGSVITYPSYRDFEAAESFEGIGAFSGRPMTVGHGEEAQRVAARLATASFFPMLGIEPHLGRFFSASEDQIGADPVAVIGHELWQSRFNGAPDVLGADIRIGGRPHTIVGVAPQGFTGVDLERVDVWLPLHDAYRESQFESRDWFWLQVVVRLAPGVSVTEAESEATTLHRAAHRHIDTYDPDASVTTTSLIAARGPGRSDESVVARWLAGVSVIVLLIACANVANLLLARGLWRRREIGVRLALGVSRRRLIRQLLTESALLGLMGGVAALLVAVWGSGTIRGVLLPTVEWTESPLSASVLVFTFVASLGAGVAAGLVPALHATRQDLAEVIGGGGRGSSARRSRPRAVLLLVQAALSVVLLVGAGLFVKSLSNVQALDFGFDPDGVIVAIPEIDRTVMSEEATTSFFLEAQRRLRSVGAVESVSVAFTMPFGGMRGGPLSVPGIERLPQFPTRGPYINPVTPEYFETMRMRMLRGRVFSDADIDGAERVVVVNETLANAFWPGRDFLGKCLKIGGPEAPCSTVVGLVANSTRAQLVEDEYGQYYVPLAQHLDRFRPDVFLVRVDPARASELVPTVRSEIQRAAPGVRFVDARTYRDRIDPRARSWRLGATMFSAFGGLALLIAAIGLYGVLAFAVAQRRREIGIRSALGASTGGIFGIVLAQSMRLTAGGLAAGVVLALAAGPWIEGMLFDVGPADAQVLVVVSLTLMLVAIVASSLPAWRASRIDPTIALQSE